MMVAFMGPDGSGKTSVIEEVTRCLAGEFESIEYFHLRFPLVPGKPHVSSAPNASPHQRTPYNLMVSVIKLLYFILIYHWGYICHFREIRSAKHLLVFDRYYHDLLVDPRRFRYGAPLFLARWVSKLIPGPQLFILLDAPTPVLQARKREVSFEETERQRQAYISLFGRLPSGHILDVERAVIDIARDSSDLILSGRAGLAGDSC